MACMAGAHEADVTAPQAPERQDETGCAYEMGCAYETRAGAALQPQEPLDIHCAEAADVEASTAVLASALRVQRKRGDMEDPSYQE